MICAEMTDARFDTIKSLLRSGEIKKFTEIFEWIPHSTIAKEFRTNNNRMKKLTENPAMWKLEEIYKLADLIGYDAKKLLMMAAKEGEQTRKL